MSKHTPGPWKLLKNEDREEYTVTTKDGKPNYHRGLASVSFGFSEPVETEQHANAKVIAAAPDLLEACKTMAEWFKREHEGFPNAGKVRTTPEGEAAWRKWWEENLRLCDLAETQANAAIIKATA
jgi:hypothetical protein